MLPSRTASSGKLPDAAQQHAAVGILVRGVGVGECIPISPSPHAPSIASQSVRSTSASE
jgi:hypothetical protein